MTEHDAQQTVVAQLSKPPGVVYPVGEDNPSGGWKSTTITGGGADADPATIQFVKTKDLPSCQMHYVRFTFRSGGLPSVSVIRTWQEDDGRVAVAPIGGGGADERARALPWVNLIAGWTGSHFMAGGSIIGKGSDQASVVTLTFTNGVVINDHVENGVVLFFEPVEVVMPALVTILDAEGTTLVAYPEFEGFADPA